jgi:hypothetical protein
MKIFLVTLIQILFGGFSATATAAPPTPPVEMHMMLCGQKDNNVIAKAQHCTSLNHPSILTVINR